MCELGLVFDVRPILVKHSVSAGSLSTELIEIVTNCVTITIYGTFIVCSETSGLCKNLSQMNLQLKININSIKLSELEQ